PGSIGYVELNYADANHLRTVALRNRAGRFVKATPDSVAAAEAGALASAARTLLVDDPVDSPADHADPIRVFTYIVVRRDLDGVADYASAQALVDFLWWTLHDGQRIDRELDDAPLADAVVAKIERAFAAIRFHDEALTLPR